jgi:hypothetical protein
MGCNTAWQPAASDGGGGWRFRVGGSLNSSHWRFSIAVWRVSALLNMLLKETFFSPTNPLFQSAVFAFCFHLY